MYTEEYLYDDFEYVDTSDISIEETSTIDTDIREHRKMKEMYKRLDKDYYSYKIIHFDGESHKQLKIELYSSPLCCNGYIRNAATGIKMEHKVGSKYDDLYFTMMDVSCKAPITDVSDIPKYPRKLYYSNPEECERHQKIIISKDVKEKWMEKNMKARSKYYRS